jgi:DNA repair exonuclease SbcCD ATPase subunit
MNDIILEAARRRLADLTAAEAQLRAQIEALENYLRQLPVLRQQLEQVYSELPSLKEALEAADGAGQEG